MNRFLKRELGNEIYKDINLKLYQYSSEYLFIIKEDFIILNLLKNKIGKDLNKLQSRTIERQINHFKNKTNTTLSSEIKDIELKLSKLNKSFNFNLKKSEESKIINIYDKKDLIGVPEEIISELKERAIQTGNDGFILTKKDYMKLLKYSDKRSLREEMYYILTNNQLSKNNQIFDNKDIINKIILERNNLAKLEGYNNFAEKKLSENILNTPDKVIECLSYLIISIKDKVLEDYKKISDFAKEKNDIKLEYWDFNYYSNNFKKENFDIDDELIKKYFPLEQVLKGLYWFIEEVFDLSIKEIRNEYIYHEDVLTLEITKNEKIVGYLYLDLIERDKKNKSFSFMSTLKHNSKVGNDKNNSVIFCNFERNEKMCLNFNQILELFHEMGHFIHYLSITGEEIKIAGIRNFSWDAVEIPSSLMENFCFNHILLEKMSCHIDTKEKIPLNLINSIKKGKEHMFFYNLFKQIEIAYIDIMIHTEYDNKENNISIPMKMKEISNSLRTLVGIPILEKDNYQFNDMQHLFLGDSYASNYYGYILGKIIASNIYKNFEENGVFCKKTGKLLVDEVLSKGGTEDFKTLLNNFNDEEFSIDSFFKYKI